jgi:hypothetical protein
MTVKVGLVSLLALNSLFIREQTGVDLLQGSWETENLHKNIKGDKAKGSPLSSPGKLSFCHSLS